MSSASSFSPFCCQCFGEIYPNTGGLVLSCGDFLCGSCEKSFHPQASCPGCNKRGVRSLRLQDNLPAQVVQNMSDISKQLEVVHSTLIFQIKHYRTTVKRAADISSASSKRSKQESIQFFDRLAAVLAYQLIHCLTDCCRPGESNGVGRR
jgi:hypothetical protein